MAFEPLSRAKAVFLLADHQTAILEHVVKTPPREHVEANVVWLARAAAAFGIPVIRTVSEERQNGELVPALERILPDAYASRIDRHGVIDAFAHPGVADALAATGRRR